jgi:putative molybdopterin biosynthesis protein
MSPSNKREFLELISIEKAQKLIFENYKWTPVVESVSLELAKNRILMEDIISSIDIPPFDRSRMDGYAVVARDTYSIDETNPITFRIIESLKAGEVSDVTLNEPFTCIEIATGAIIPRGANAVVMVEYTSLKDDNEVEIFRPVFPQENIEFAGSDIMYGETVIRSGEIISSVKTGILAALGIQRVKVLKKLIVGVLSTGDEIRRPDDNGLDNGCIYDSNSIILRNLLDDMGVISKDLGICPDDMSKLKNVVKKALKTVDILLISGGTSAGEGDYSYRVITDLGGRQLFHGVSSKPGKPLSAGIINNKLIITLPGFPSSAIFSFNTVVAPLLSTWSKSPMKDLVRVKAKISQPMKNNSGRFMFKLVHLLKSEKSNEYCLFPVKGTSGSVSVLERADGYISIPENVSILNYGELVDVTLFQKQVNIADLVFAGSHDFVIDKLFREFSKKYPKFISKLVFVGSSGGLSALSREESDIAGSHLLDDEKNEYNIPFLEKFQILDKVTIIKGYIRTQGFYVAKGNPKKIKAIDDLLRSDITFMNRIEGSGTRLLIDRLLNSIREKHNFKSFEDLQKHIRGYYSVASSHSATVSAVARGVVDVSIGIRSFAKLFDVDFIPLAEERYDLVIRNKSIEKPAIKALLDLFKSKNFRTSIEQEIGEINWQS